jgi:tetratricopeptide (TPR) repeat protein
MKTTTCGHCGKINIPKNDTFIVDGIICCASCLEKEFPEPGQLESRSVAHAFDPTVCTTCGTDHGELELQKIVNHPTCAYCVQKIREKSFPRWVKMFMAGLILLVTFAFMWNLRFFKAHRQIRIANEALAKGDFKGAMTNMDEAGKNIPEIKFISTGAEYFRGIYLLNSKKSGEALRIFEQLTGKLPPGYNLPELINQARIGEGFDNGDYELFLSATLENLENDFGSAMSWAYVASAYACLYAESGNDSMKHHAREHLQKARELDSTVAEMKNYYNMIEYRLYAKEIIDSKEFDRRFPEGWHKPR